MRLKRNLQRKKPSDGEKFRALGAKKGGSGKIDLFQRATIFEQRNHENVYFLKCFWGGLVLSPKEGLHADLAGFQILYLSKLKNT